MNIQLGIVSYPDGQYRRLTTDTNAYLYPSVAADGRTLVASQIQSKYEIEIASFARPDEVHALRFPLGARFGIGIGLTTAESCWRKPRTSASLSPKAAKRSSIRTQITFPIKSCPAGIGNTSFIARQAAPARSTFNLWRMTTSGADSKQLTSGSADSDPFCSADGKWVYYVDYTRNQALKRVSLDGGSPETILSPANGITQFSPDGKTSSALKFANSITN